MAHLRCHCSSCDAPCTPNLTRGALIAHNWPPAVLLQRRKERPARDYLFAGANRLLDTEVHRPQVQQGQVLWEAQSYRLDIELGKLEFTSHPLMSREDQLVRWADWRQPFVSSRL
jgi:hypothetical protein